MQPYSMDLRQRVLADCDAGLSTAAVAAKFTVSTAWVRRLKQRRRETGDVAPRCGRHGPQPSWDTYAEPLREAVRTQPDATLAELREKLALACALSTPWRAVAALGLTERELHKQVMIERVPFDLPGYLADGIVRGGPGKESLLVARFSADAARTADIYAVPLHN